MASKKQTVDDIRPEYMKTGEINRAISRGGRTTGQAPAGAEEKALREAGMRTQGRKGCKAPRFNFRTTPDKYKFVNVMARVRGESVAAFMNTLLDDYIEKHPDQYKRAMEFIDEEGNQQ